MSPIKQDPEQFMEVMELVAEAAGVPIDEVISITLRTGSYTDGGYPEFHIERRTKVIAATPELLKAVHQARLDAALEAAKN
jgi:hypothetical protein